MASTKSEAVKPRWITTDTKPGTLFGWARALKLLKNVGKQEEAEFLSMHIKVKCDNSAQLGNINWQKFKI